MYTTTYVYNLEIARTSHDTKNTVNKLRNR